MPARYHNSQDGEEYTRVTIRLDGEQADKIEQLMKPEGKYATLSDVIREAIHQFVVQQEKTANIEKILVALPKNHYKILKEEFKTDEAINDFIVNGAIPEYIKNRKEWEQKWQKYQEIVNSMQNN
jgi:Arc/MetJ-type ribon-helix-helix transcriptional regulator